MRTSTAKNKKAVSELLRLLAGHGDALAKLLLSRGRWFDGRGDSHDYEATDAWRKAHRPKPRQCYSNAQAFCLDHSEGRYFEGYAYCGVLAVPHAWVVMPDERVIDFTWEAKDRKLRRLGIASDSTGAVYLGVQVPRAQMARMIADTGWCVPYYGGFATEEAVVSGV